MTKNREELKSYFEQGDTPSAAQFAAWIDAYPHLNEFGFGLNARSSGDTRTGIYDFYIANDPRYVDGHYIKRVSSNAAVENRSGYQHILRREVPYKILDVEIIGDINIAEHQPKLIIERYKQVKRYNSGYKRPAGYYKEKFEDASRFNRKSEYPLVSKKSDVDIGPIHYFRPNKSFRGNSFTDDQKFRNFMPSGAVHKYTGAYQFLKHKKPFVPIRLRLQIQINGKTYLSPPTDLKIVLGRGVDSNYRELNDAINYYFE